MTEQTAEQQEERKQLLRKAYGEATSELRERYRSEFDNLYAERARALGVDYTPRLTPEQKAEQQLRELLEQHPNLREKFAGDNVAPQQEERDPLNEV